MTSLDLETPVGEGGPSRVNSTVTNHVQINSEGGGNPINGAIGMSRDEQQQIRLDIPLYLTMYKTKL